jgi:hypothetical protein
LFGVELPIPRHCRPARSAVDHTSATLGGGAAGTALGLLLHHRRTGEQRWPGLASLQPLDAIHLSAAISLGAVEMLTYDRRLAEAAESLGVKAIP